MESHQNDILEKVKAFAAEAHAGQKRKYADEPYINHPARVMAICREYTEDTAILSAALLHDVLEDTPVTKKDIHKFLATVMDKGVATITLHLVEELTDVFVKSDYPSLNRRTRRKKEAERLSDVSPEAQTVKYADILDNVTDIAKQDTDFALVYIRECKQILQEVNKGNPDLYQRAVQTVDDCLQQVFSKANIKAL